MADLWRLIEIPYYREPSGVLGVLEFERQIPFVVRRVFWVFGVPDPAEVRGEHAHGELRQVIFCARGSCVLDVESPQGDVASFELSEGGAAVYLDGSAWRSMRRFSADCAMMVLCDREYRFDRVVDDRAEFLSNAG
jgi:hypothetical protein